MGLGHSSAADILDQSLQITWNACHSICSFFDGTYAAGDEFNRVQELIKGTNRIPRQKQRFAYTGLIRCGVCGCQITAERKVKHYWTTGRTVEYVYYRCTGRRGCPLGSVSETYLTRRIFGLLSTWRIEDDARALAERAIGREEQASLASAGTIRQTKEATRQDLERRLNTLYVMRENEEISSEEFVQRKKRYADELGSIDQAIARTSDLVANNARAVRQAVQYLNEAPPKFPNASLDEKREIASILADSYVLTLGKLTIRPDPTLLTLATLEPLKTGSYQVGGGGSDPENPSQRCLFENIRTEIANDWLGGRNSPHTPLPPASP